MTTPFKYDYACGLMVSDLDGHPAIKHGGEMEGFTSDMIYYPEDKLTVVVLNNLSGEAQTIALKLASVAHGEKIVLPSERKDVTVPSAVLERYVGTYSDISPGYDLVIALENGHLVSQVTGSNTYKEKKHTLAAESEKVFFQKEFEGEYQFRQNDSGEITSVLCNYSGHKSVARKK